MALRPYRGVLSPIGEPVTDYDEHTAAKTADRERGEIPRLVERLEQSIHHLSLSTSGLLDRLAPVAALENETKKSGERDRSDIAASTALGRSLAQANAEIEALQAAVNRFTHALQI